MSPIVGRSIFIQRETQIAPALRGINPFYYSKVALVDYVTIHKIFGVNSDGGRYLFLEI